jgi:hypothetical protein
MNVLQKFFCTLCILLIVNSDAGAKTLICLSAGFAQPMNMNYRGDFNTSFVPSVQIYTQVSPQVYLGLAASHERFDTDYKMGVSNNAKNESYNFAHGLRLYLSKYGFREAAPYITGGMALSIWNTKYQIHMSDNISTSDNLFGRSGGSLKVRYVFSCFGGIGLNVPLWKLLSLDVQSLFRYTNFFEQFEETLGFSAGLQYEL